MAVTMTVVGSEEEGERRERVWEVPVWRMWRRERLKLGNLIGSSFALIGEQKSGPCDHLEERPWVWSEWKCVKKYASLPFAQRSTDIKPSSIFVDWERNTNAYKKCELLSLECKWWWEMRMREILFYILYLGND